MKLLVFSGELPFLKDRADKDDPTLNDSDLDWSTITLLTNDPDSLQRNVKSDIGLRNLKPVMKKP